MKALLSIKPEYVEKIFSGEKKFEYRKSLFSKKDIKTVIIYATMPIGKVVGEFEIDKIINLKPQELWAQTKDHSGISESFFFEYFDKRSQGIAIKIKSFKKYSLPKCIKKDFNLTPPQSFIYINEN